MNRQLFLAELNQYLAFLPQREREYIITGLAAKFDEAGPQAEPELLMELGTPMSIAIALKRRKEAGESLCPEGFIATGRVVDPEEIKQKAEELSKHPGIKGMPSEDDGAKKPKAPTAQETLVKKLLDEERNASEANEVENRADAIIEDDKDAGFAQTVEAEPKPEGNEEPPEGEYYEENIVGEEYVDETWAPDYEDGYLETEEEYIAGISSDGAARMIDPPTVVKKKLTPGKIVLGSLVSVVVTAVFAVLALLGLMVFYCGLRFTYAGLGTLATLNDALWLFASGFALLAAGLLLVWLGVWVPVVVIHRLFIGKAEGKFKAGLGQFTRTVMILIVVFLILAVGCGAGSYFNDGYIDIAFKHPAGQYALERILNWPVGMLLKLFGISVPVG